MEEFPGNSRRPVPPPAKIPPTVEDKKLEPVVSGKVIRRKKPLGRRFMDTFFNGDSGVFVYIFKEVLVPALQDLATDLVKQTVERAVYGEVRSPRSRGTGVRTQVSYDRMSTRHHPATRNAPSVRRPAALQSSMEEYLGEIILDSQINAEVVADKLLEDLRNYPCVTVADLKQRLGESPEYTDHKWGWTDLSDMRIRRIREGYLLILPDLEDLR